MNWGSYSVKFIRGRVERKIVQYFSFHEKILREVPSGPGHNSNESSHEVDVIGMDAMEAIQFGLIEDYLKEYSSVEKIIIDLPAYYSTLRFINLPVKYKKKIEQMIPFQLEEELPYPVTEAHFAIFPIITQKGSYTITMSIHTRKFDPFFERTQKLPHPPNAIIARESIYQAFILEYDLSDPVAIIDFGHSESTCYLFYNKRLVGTEASFVCGQMMDEVIAETYRISAEEAILFKHQNAFFLTDEQAQNADQNQQDFSLLMKKIFSNFIDDFKRWSVGYQLRTRQNLQRVFITGGMSNIKNIDYFLAQSLGIEVAHFDFLQQTAVSDLALPLPQRRSLTACYGLSYHLTTKNGLSNFCNKNYAASGGSEFPLEAISFVGVRVAMVCIFLLATLIFENICLSEFNRKITRKITDQLKDPLFAMTPGRRRKMLRDPKKLLASLEDKDKQIIDQISILNKIIDIDGLGPLGELGRAIDRSLDVELISFKHENKNIQAIFKAKDNKSLKSLEMALKARVYGDMQTVLQEEQKTLELTYNDEE